MMTGHNHTHSGIFKTITILIECLRLFNVFIPMHEKRRIVSLRRYATEELRHSYTKSPSLRRPVPTESLSYEFRQDKPLSDCSEEITAGRLRLAILYGIPSVHS
jgi:hypothetical protein